MGSLYVNTDAIEFVFNTEADLSDAKSIVIKAESPTGVKTDKIPTVIESNGIVKYQVSSKTEFTEAGIWKFYLIVTYNDDTIACSELGKVNFSRQGS